MVQPCCWKMYAVHLIFFLFLRITYLQKTMAEKYYVVFEVPKVVHILFRSVNERLLPKWLLCGSGLKLGYIYFVILMLFSISRIKTHEDNNQTFHWTRASFNKVIHCQVLNIHLNKKFLLKIKWNINFDYDIENCFVKWIIDTLLYDITQRILLYNLNWAFVKIVSSSLINIRCFFLI